jgi:ABC-type multidrug transport system fused ATPase/permease subunit
MPPHIVQNYSTPALIRDIGSYVRPYRRRFIVGSLLRFLGDLINLYPAIALASIVNFFTTYKAGDSLNYFFAVLGLWAAAAIWRTFAAYSGKYIIYQIAEKTSLDAQLKVIKHIFALDIAWHEKENAGNKLKKIQKGSSGLDRIIRLWVNNYIEISVNFVGMLFILSRGSSVIGILVAVFLVTYFILSFGLLRKASEIAQHVNAQEEEMEGLVFQSINNIRSVKVAGIAGSLHKKIAGQADEIFRWVRKRVRRFQARGAILNLWVISFRFGSMIYIGYSIYQGASNIGFLILFNNYFLRILESVSELSESTQDFIINKYSVARMQELLLEPIRIDNEKGKVSFPKNWQKITVKNLSFSYGHKAILKNISFEINRGERIGIIGLSGAGKSTLFKLLLKETEDYTGDILFDGLSIRKIKKSSYYQRVGVVLQETEVFNFTLRENITITADSQRKRDDKLSQALDISHVKDFVAKLPQGIDTFIGEKGVKLSGGEKQRLGIARAIYKQPELLFLDEATSHLDLESEEKIKDSLHAFFQKVTAVVVAHRLTTIKEMDKILVIEKGELVESGNFNELYGQQGRFYQLWSKQKL